VNITGAARVKSAAGCYANLADVSEGKDSNIGHWEISGTIKQQKFPLYPKGLPRDVLETFPLIIVYGKKLGNMPVSGTGVINELDDQQAHIRFPDLYTANDSVFRIAANQYVMPV
jgi:phosphopentomutase